MLVRDQRIRRVNIMNKYIDSGFDDFLEEEGLLEESESIAAKRVFVYQLEKELKKQNLSKTDFAYMMGTSRSAVNRILDPNKPSNLKSLAVAARTVEKHLTIKLV